MGRLSGKRAKVYYLTCSKFEPTNSITTEAVFQTPSPYYTDCGAVGFMVRLKKGPLRNLGLRQIVLFRLYCTVEAPRACS